MLLKLADHGDCDGQPDDRFCVHGEGDEGDDATTDTARNERAAVAFDASQRAQ